METIKGGETICFLNGESCTLDEVLQRVNDGREAASDPLGVGVDEYLDLEENARTFNHSCEPNSFIRGRNELVALRDISCGEEIIYDYSTTMDDDEERILKAGRDMWTCECNCGSEKCRGVINQFKTLPEEIRDFYIRNEFVPNFILKKFGS